MIPNYLLVARMGLLDSSRALILPHIRRSARHPAAGPGHALLPARGGRGRPHGWRQQLAILWEVLVPNLRGTIASLAILIFISTWNEYFWPLLLSRTAENSVVQIGIQMFMTAEGNQWGPLMAASTLASLPVLVI
ncbi:MAG: hypothetical protein NVV79_22275 [Devosia ginsengisoli]|nr:hypothetical protein [Devosia ginsengisoli]